MFHSIVQQNIVWLRHRESPVLVQAFAPQPPRRFIYGVDGFHLVDLIGCFVRTSLHSTNVRIVAMDGNELTVSILSPKTKAFLEIQGNTLTAVYASVPLPAARPG